LYFRKDGRCTKIPNLFNLDLLMVLPDKNDVYILVVPKQDDRHSNKVRM